MPYIKNICTEETSTQEFLSKSFLYFTEIASTRAMLTLNVKSMR